MSIVVITGPPGAGKTTVAAAVARAGPLGVLAADQFFHWITSGYVAPWLPESKRQNATVIGAIGAAAARSAESGYDVVVDGIVGPWFLGRFQQAIGSAADTLGYVVLRPSREVARKRALGRTEPQDLVEPGPIGAMYDAFMDLGPFESHVIDSSHHQPAVTVETVRRGLEQRRFVPTPNDNSS